MGEQAHLQDNHSSAVLMLAWHLEKHKQKCISLIHECTLQRRNISATRELFSSSTWAGHQG